MKSSPETETGLDLVSRCAALSCNGFKQIAFFAGLLACCFPCRISSQSFPYGLRCQLAHSARIMEQNTTLDQDEVIKQTIQSLSYAYDIPLSATGAYGTSRSGLRAAITPGILRFSWLGESSVAGGLGNTSASSYSRASISLDMGWEESFTVTCPSLPMNAEVILDLSHGLTGTISKTSNPASPNVGSLNIEVWVEVNANNDQQTSQFHIDSSNESINLYRVMNLRTRVGETIRLSMGIQAGGGVYTDLYEGAVAAVGAPDTVRLEAGSYDSCRFGIRATNPDVILTSASGYKYPGHAMSLKQITEHFSNLKIKRVDYGPTAGTVSFVIDAIPGVSYVLQQSTNLDKWKTVGDPVNPADFGELVLPETPSPEPSQFWRIAATPLP